MEGIAKIIVIVNLISALKVLVMVIFQIKLDARYMMIVKAKYATKIYVELAFMVNPIFKLQL